MSEKDRMLIERANNTSCYDWYSISSLILEAESEEAKQKLEQIRNNKYHMEEYKSGLD